MLNTTVVLYGHTPSERHLHPCLRGGVGRVPWVGLGRGDGEHRAGSVREPGPGTGAAHHLPPAQRGLPVDIRSSQLGGTLD